MRRSLLLAVVAAVVSALVFGAGVSFGSSSATAPPKRLWAVVNGDGTLVAGEGVKSAGRNCCTTDQEGEYRVIFTRTIQKCAVVASVGSNPYARKGIENTAGATALTDVPPASSAWNAVVVTTGKTNGSPNASYEFDMPFNVEVMCP